MMKKVILPLLLSWAVMSGCSLWKDVEKEKKYWVNIEPVFCLLSKDSLAQDYTHLKLLKFLGNWEYVFDTLLYNEQLMDELTYCNEWWEMKFEWCSSAKVTLDSIESIDWFEFMSRYNLTHPIGEGYINDRIAYKNELPDGREVGFITSELRIDNMDVRKPPKYNLEYRWGNSLFFLQCVENDYVLLSDEWLNDFKNQGMMVGIWVILKSEIKKFSQAEWSLYKYKKEDFMTREGQRLKHTNSALPLETRRSLQKESCKQYIKGIEEIKRKIQNDIQTLEDVLKLEESYTEEQCPYGLYDPYGDYGDIEALKSKIEDLKQDLENLSAFTIGDCDAIQEAPVSQSCFSINNSGVIMSNQWCEEQSINSISIFTAQWKKLYYSDSISLPFNISNVLSGSASGVYYINIVRADGVPETLTYIK